MVSYINFLFAFFFFFSCTTVEKSDKKISYTIEDYFTKIRTVRLDTSKYLSIRYLEVNNRQDFLITNDSRSSVILYDSLGKFKRDLSASADSSFPGINWRPNRGFFMQGDEIFVSNNVPWGLYFDRNGSFIEPLPKEYIAGSDLAFDRDGSIYSFNSNRNGIYVSKHSKENYKADLKFGEYPKKFTNIIDKAIIGNSLLVNNNSLFLKNIAEPRIYKYDLNGNFMHSFIEIPSYYKEPKNDVRLRPISTLRNDIFKFAKKYTANYSIHQLNENTLLIQYLNFGYNYGIQLLDTAGSYILDKDLVIKEKIMFTKNNFIYTINNEEKDKKKNLLQPSITIYKLKDSVLNDN